MKTRVVVCDTSPLRVLAHVSLLHILDNFFTEVLIPPAVARELEAPERSFPSVELATIPGCRVQEPKDANAIRELEAELQTAEAEAIVLARETEAELLIDERTGRLTARRLGIRYTGVIGLLVRAKQEGLIQDVLPVILRARDEMNFFLSDELIEEIRELLASSG